jgi:hypothetical protein
MRNDPHKKSTVNEKSLNKYQRPTFHGNRHVLFHDLDHDRCHTHYCHQNHLAHETQSNHISDPPGYFLADELLLLPSNKNSTMGLLLAYFVPIFSFLYCISYGII